jgi:hypothetical protein
MTRDQLKKYFLFKAKASSFPTEDLDEHIEQAVEIGIQEVWNANYWRFRQQKLTISTTENVQADGSIEIGQNLSGVGVVWFGDSQNAGQLEYKTFEEYNTIFPEDNGVVLLSRAAGIYTLRWDSLKERVYLYIAGKNLPSTVNAIVFPNQVPATSQFPDKAMKAIRLAVYGALLPIGSNEFLNTENLYREELLLLEKKDGLYGGTLWRIPTAYPASVGSGGKPFFVA